jgi:hypothetical protein
VEFSGVASGESPVSIEGALAGEEGAGVGAGTVGADAEGPSTEAKVTGMFRSAATFTVETTRPDSSIRSKIRERSARPLS